MPDAVPPTRLPRPTPRGAMSVVVASGGILGATLRWAAVRWQPVEVGTWPWTTLAVNLVGCLAIGLVAGHLLHRPRAAAFVVTGVLGGFTTYSTFAVETDRLVTAGRPTAAAAYVAASVAGGIAAVGLGRLVGGHRPVLGP